jgi:Zn-dependent peptidase ImmA (M78 family)
MSGNELFIGSKQDFALYVEFIEDPENGLSVTAEESVSWGAVQVWVRGMNLSSHLEGTESIPSVHWYLLPLIEWLTANWDPLLHEERLPIRNADMDAWSSLQETRFPPKRLKEEEEDKWRVQWQEWWFRHSFQACRSGGLFPDIVIRRCQDMVEVAWGSSVPLGAPDDVIFAYDEGFVRFEPKLVAERLHDFLRQAAGYLLSRLPSSERFRKLEQNVSAIRSTSRDNRIAWLAGLGSSAQAVFNKWHEIVESLRSISQEVTAYLLEDDDNDLVIVGSCHAGLMFGSASPNLVEKDLNTLAHKLIELYIHDAESAELKKLVAYEPINLRVKEIWDIGYDLAQRVIDHLSLVEQNSDFVDVDSILNTLEIHKEEIELSDNMIRGVSVAGPHHKASILINKSDLHNRTLEGKRFTIAHELCHIMFDRTYARKLAMVSGEWAPLQVEKRAGAFAAMLLMPRDLVRRVVDGLGGPISSEQHIHDIRRQFGTSFKATLEHLRNLEELDSTTADRIEAEREDRLSQEGCS